MPRKSKKSKKSSKVPKPPRHNLSARPAFVPGKGVGMVALRDFAVGELLWVLPAISDPPYAEVRVTKSGSTPEVWKAVQDFTCMSAGTRSSKAPERFTPLVFDASQLANHSEDPNAMMVNAALGGTGVVAMLALRAIRAGEEIEHNFRLSCRGEGHSYLRELDEGKRSIKPAVRVPAYHVWRSGGYEYTLPVSDAEDVRGVYLVALDKQPPPGEDEDPGEVFGYPFSHLPDGTRVWGWDEDSGSWVLGYKNVMVV